MRASLIHEDEEIGTVRLCQGCGEDWPLDGEFWYFDAKGYVMGHCKACWADRNLADRKLRQARIAPMMHAYRVAHPRQGG
jgi:hypothetical protein